MESKESDNNINKDDNNEENITWNDLVSIFKYTINDSFITLHSISTLSLINDRNIWKIEFYKNYIF